MRRLLCIVLSLLICTSIMASAESGDAFYPVPQNPEQVRAQDEARLIDLGFLTESGSDTVYQQAVREFQRYLNGLSADTPAEGLPSTTLEVLGELKEDATRALSIKKLPTYSDIDAIEAFQKYAVVDNEGELGADSQDEIGAEYALGPDDAESPYQVTGTLDEPQRTRLYDQDLPVYQQALKEGDDGSEVRRVQRRLITLKYTDHVADGIFDGKTVTALTRFQQASDQPGNGEADRATQQALFSEAAVPNDQPLYDYLLKISTEKQTVTAYAWEDGDYTRPAREMVCSTGLDDTPTPAGTYKATGPVARWCYFPSYGCWAQYAFRIKGGVLFHSVLYEQAKESTLLKGSVKKLGQKSSHGCVRMSVEDAKWIFDHCTAGTTVIVE
jgi:lipoprotein-anchoring transpeptidase ErfK/SrfK